MERYLAYIPYLFGQDYLFGFGESKIYSNFDLILCFVLVRNIVQNLLENARYPVTWNFIIHI